MGAGGIRVRLAVLRDLATLVEFNRALALETEDRELDPERLRLGVSAVLADPARGSYHVAVRGEEPLGALLLTSEWSDWRNGVFWWIQSVYVVPAERRSGVFRKLYDHVVERARASGDVCGLRLYVDHENRIAQEVYRELGMSAARYRMFELDFVLSEPGGRGTK
jgi:GNAT superfamily N-acetyltransferase